MELRLLALYPDQMNIYADRGNILFLRKRCEWRGIGFAYAAAGPGEGFDPGAHDLLYLGGGQDRDQRAVAADMVETKREALAAAVDDGAVMLAVCGGYQLLGHSYQLGEERLPGIGLADLDHRPRAGAAADRQRRDRGRPRRGAADDRRLREPRRQDLPRRERDPARPGRQGIRQQRRRRARGRPPRQPDRDLPARPAAAEERLAGRPPDRAGAGAALRHPPSARAARRRPRARRGELGPRGRDAQLSARAPVRVVRPTMRIQATAGAPPRIPCHPARRRPIGRRRARPAPKARKPSAAKSSARPATT